MNRIAIAGFLLCVFLITGRAQEPAIPRVPSLARATISIAFNPRTGNSEETKVPTAISVTRFEKTQLNRIAWSDATFSESYFVENYLVSKSPHGNWINIFNVETDLIDPIYYLTRPNAFSWVGPSTFVRAETFQDKPANLFQRKKDDSETKESIWCDPAIGLPMAWSDGTNVCTFAFGQPPSSAPVLAAEFKRELDQFIRLATVPKQISNRP